jgi:ketosteroid isomerase-like protein
MVTDDNKAIVRAAFDVFMSDDQSALDDLLAPGCVLHQCGFLEPIRGAEAIKHRRAGQFVSERTVHLEENVADGDLVAIQWQTSGLYVNAYRPDKLGRPISFGSMSFLRVDGDKIQEIWNIQDMSTVSAQLGWDERRV